MTLSRVSLTYFNPLFVETDYHVEVIEKVPEKVKVNVRDGGKLMLSATFYFRPGDATASGSSDERPTPLSEPIVWRRDQLTTGLEVAGRYLPSEAPCSPSATAGGSGRRGLRQFRSALAGAAISAACTCPRERYILAAPDGNCEGPALNGSFDYRAAHRKS